VIEVHPENNEQLLFFRINNYWPKICFLPFSKQVNMTCAGQVMFIYIRHLELTANQCEVDIACTGYIQA
jgi:hypothetical protein